MTVACDTGAPSAERVAALVTECQETLARFEYDAAEKSCRLALAADPQCADALLLLAAILADTGRVDDAAAALENAISAHPDAGHEHYVALAQMRTGESALALYERGLANVSLEPGVRASILCAMAEIYMTDLCMQSDAEARCEAYVTEALAAAESDAVSLAASHGEAVARAACGASEAYLALANLRLCQTRPDDAVAAVQRSLDCWADVPFDSDAFPDYEHRLATARLLVELGAFAPALALLDALCLEDDSLVEPWYLCALCHYSTGLAQTADGASEACDWRACMAEALGRAEALVEQQGTETVGNLADAIRELRDVIGADAVLSAADEDASD